MELAPLYYWSQLGANWLHMAQTDNSKPNVTIEMVGEGKRLPVMPHPHRCIQLVRAG